MVAIIDYDAGNIKSVEKALLHLGEEVMITRDREKILNSDKVILPGVGAFGDAMEKLRSYGLDKVIMKWWRKRFLFWEFVLVCSFFLKRVMKLRE